MTDQPRVPASMAMLELRGPLHIGEVGIGREETLSYVPSDTLFSALVSAWAAREPGEAQRELGEWLSDFLTDPPNPPFRLTSAFPWAGGVRFYPRPLGLQGWSEPKKTKRIRWVSEGIFQSLVTGQQLTAEQKQTNLLHDGTVWVLGEERDAIARALKLSANQEVHLWWEDVAPRVTVDRLANRSNLFHTGRAGYASGGGLWFAVRFRDDAARALWRPRIQEALATLADMGLGGLRSQGHGGFHFKWEEEAEVPAGDLRSGYMVTLARYVPRDAAEIERTLRPSGTSYSLVRVGGWCMDDAYHAWRRKPLRLVAEGSLLGHDGGAPGRLVDVTPEPEAEPRPIFHNGRRVYRYGLAFPVAVDKRALRPPEERA